MEAASSKNYQFGDCCPLIVVRENSTSPLCPVCWLRRLLRWSDPNANVKPKKGEHFIPMSYEWFRNKLSVTVTKSQT